MGIGRERSWILSDINGLFKKKSEYNFHFLAIVNLLPVQKNILFCMAILTSDIKEFVKTNKLGFVATVCPDGTPNLSPKGTTIVWDDEHLVFADIHSPETVRNLMTNPSVEINFADVFTRKGYRFKGVAQIISGGPVFDEVIASYGEAASKYKINNIVMVRVDRIIRITSPVYDTGTSEEEVKNRWIDYWHSLYPHK
jgi:predicted pyridoxine 5'-phosphate oxidase superfamily flavin-nucleotide-binding protein